jgi:NAD(P)-dependent dehydrogenase (short-subunit alcohol dehydrogenase family)
MSTISPVTGGNRGIGLQVCRQLAGSHIAHGEINALAQLTADRHYEDHALLTLPARPG